jgi:hypothetical protein
MFKTIRGGLFAAAVVACMGVSPCATFDLDLAGHKKNLEDTQLKYVHFLRWGEYEAASMLVEKDHRDAFTANIPAFENIRLSDYDILETNFNELETEATSLVTFRAYHLSRMIEQKWVEEQVWVRDELTKRWSVKPDMKKIRTALSKMQPR